MKMLWELHVYCGLLIIFVCLFNLLVLNGFLESDCNQVTTGVASLFLSFCLLNTISFCVFSPLPLCLAFRPSVAVESAIRKNLPLK